MAIRVGDGPANPPVRGTAPVRDGKAPASVVLTLALDTYDRSAVRKFEESVRKAATKAQDSFAGKPRKCYKTTAKFVALMGATSATNPSVSSRGLPLSHLEKLLELGKLKPGMQIYVNKKPGTDPQSLKLGNLPHWAIYVGKDSKGAPRFMDQYRDDWSLSDFIATYGNSRKIDTIFDPLKAKRPTTPAPRPPQSG